MIEYGIIDDQGNLFGLPAKTFTTKAAAETTYEFLQQRRADMKREAYDAAMRLQTGVKDVAEGYRLQDVVDQWDRERQRHFQVMCREVGEWERA